MPLPTYMSPRGAAVRRERRRRLRQRHLLDRLRQPPQGASAPPSRRYRPPVPPRRCSCPSLLLAVCSCSLQYYRGVYSNWNPALFRHHSCTPGSEQSPSSAHGAPLPSGQGRASLRVLESPSLLLQGRSRSGRAVPPSANAPHVRRAHCSHLPGARTASGRAAPRRPPTTRRTSAPTRSTGSTWPSRPSRSARAGARRRRCGCCCRATCRCLYPPPFVLILIPVDASGSAPTGISTNPVGASPPHTPHPVSPPRAPCSAAPARRTGRRGRTTT